MILMIVMIFPEAGGLLISEMLKCLEWITSENSGGDEMDLRRVGDERRGESRGLGAWSASFLSRSASDGQLPT